MAGRPHWYPPRCRICGKTNPDGGRVSQTGLCVNCGRKRMNDARAQLQALRGPFALYWAAKLAQSLGFPPLDSEPPRP